MTCDVHDRGRQWYLHRTHPPTQRVLRRRLLRDPDANGRRTLRVGETAGPDLSEHAPELRLTLGSPLRQTTASPRRHRRRPGWLVAWAARSGRPDRCTEVDSPGRGPDGSVSRHVLGRTIRLCLPGRPGLRMLPPFG